MNTIWITGAIELLLINGALTPAFSAHGEKGILLADSNQRIVTREQAIQTATMVKTGTVKRPQ